MLTRNDKPADGGKRIGIGAAFALAEATILRITLSGVNACAPGFRLDGRGVAQKIFARE